MSSKNGKSSATPSTDFLVAKVTSLGEGICSFYCLKCLEHFKTISSWSSHLGIHVYILSDVLNQTSDRITKPITIDFKKKCV